MLTLDDYDYHLPPSLVAQQPLPDRTASRLMVVDRASSSIQHDQFSHILNYIKPDDVLVLNNTRVIPARLYGAKETGGKVECLVERVLPDNQVLVHLRSSKSPKPGARLIFESVIEMVMVERVGELFQLHVLNDEPILTLLDKYGHMPLPPYIERPDDLADRDRYQTVFGHQAGAVAAPTASLHFDTPLLDTIKAQGTAVVEVTLHVGAGTFQPVRVDDVRTHRMHQEWIDVSPEAVKTIEQAKGRGGRVMAVGTTVVRALETASQSGVLAPYTGETEIFIYPGFEFQCVNQLITNFHLPKSTLLMLVSALAGYELMLEAYARAVESQYRFFSYGDAMLIL